jgi:hypothetical protein
MFSEKPKLKRKFSPAEDAALKQLVEENGTNDWAKIASQMRARDSRQCKERWYHYLMPELVKLPWAQADDILLECKVAEQGRKWKMFESSFPGRTDIDIKNRYNVLARRRLRRLRIPFDSAVKEFAYIPGNFVSEPPSPTGDFSTDVSDWDELLNQ